MPTALAISPHLDDAVFSAGGTLACLAREDWRVVIATVFTASVDNPSGFALACQLDKGLSADVDYMALRRKEDAAACRRLGAEAIWLPYVEAPHRGYENAVQLFGRLRDDDAIVCTIAPSIAATIHQINPDVVLAPQAVGAHVDHVAVFLALQAYRGPLWAWVDFPYAIRDAFRPSPFRSDLARFSRNLFAISEGDLKAKLEAMSQYASQLAFQFGGQSAMKVNVLNNGAEEHFAVRASDC